jgi:antitoxin FitA
VSVPELLRAEAARIAARPSMEEWLKRTRRRSAPMGRIEILAALDEQRGSWPDAGG